MKKTSVTVINPHGKEVEITLAMRAESPFKDWKLAEGEEDIDETEVKKDDDDKDPEKKDEDTDKGPKEIFLALAAGGSIKVVEKVAYFQDADEQWEVLEEGAYDLADGAEILVGPAGEVLEVETK